MSRSREQDPPAGRLVQPGEHVEERGLAGAVGPDDRDDRATRDVERDVGPRPPARRTPCVTSRRCMIGDRAPARGPATRRSRHRLSRLDAAQLCRARPARSRRSRPVSSSFRRRSGNRPCGRSTITITSRKPKMPSCRSVRLKLSPKLPGRVEHVRDQVVVDVGEQQRADHDAPDRPEAAEDHHREHEDRERELELAASISVV